MNLVFATAPRRRRRQRARRLIATPSTFTCLDPMPIPSRHDQAAGLRRMFAGACARFVPVVSNPHVVCGGVLLERLSTAFAERGARVLVVDAGESAGSAGEMAMVDLGACVERLSPQVAYLAARGLAIRFVDAGGSTRTFLERAAEAAPGCDVVIVHAPASELCRLFAPRAPRRVGPRRCRSAVPDRRRRRPPAERDPCLRVDEAARAARQPRRQRAAARRRAAVAARRADRRQARGCADTFFAGVLRDWAWIDPAGDPCDAPGSDLRRLVAARFENDAAIGASARPVASQAVAWAVQ